SSYYKNKVNSNRNVLKEILGNIPDEEMQNKTKEKKNKQLSEIINEFNKSYVKKNNIVNKAANTNLKPNNGYLPQSNFLIKDKNNNSNKVVINPNETMEKIPLNLMELSSDSVDKNSNAFIFNYLKKNEGNRVSD